MSSKPDKEEVMQQASSLWQMLDEMAANDPAAYRKFIDKQTKSGKEYMKPPEPHMCVQTIIMGVRTPFFINMFEWARIPKPKSDEDPIPCMGGEVYQLEEGDEEEKDDCRVVSVGFNPEVTDMFGLESTLREERKMLINLAIDFVENQHKLKISRNYSILPKKTRCKGPVKTAVKTLMKRYGGGEEDLEDQLKDLEDSLPFARGMKDSLMGELGNIGAGSNAKDKRSKSSGIQTSHNGEEPQIRFPMDTEVKKEGLIEEVSSETISVPEPVYSLEEKEKDGRKVLVVKVNLPGVKSVAECDLDISKIDVHLDVGSKYELTVKLPKQIDDSKAGAKFSKKSSSLTLTLPLLDGQ